MTDPRGGPIGGASNWTAGYMPAAYQGTLFRGKGSPLLDLATPAGHRATRAQRRDLDLLEDAQPRTTWRPPRRDRAGRPHPVVRAGLPDADQRRRGRRPRPRGRPRPASRTAWTTTAPRDFGRKCLMTRRLLEKGVRFVQLYSGGGHLEDTWDGHSDCITNHTHPRRRDRPADRRPDRRPEADRASGTRRCSIWGGEFGRTPTSEGVGKPGRDHNPHGFSMWLAGAGVKGGQAIGATDELGFDAVEDRGPRRRPPRHDPAPDGPRPHPADLLPRRPRPAADRRQGGRDPSGARVRRPATVPSPRWRPPQSPSLSEGLRVGLVVRHGSFWL